MGEWRVVSADANRFVRWRPSDHGWVRISFVLLRDGAETRTTEVGLSLAEMTHILHAAAASQPESVSDDAADGAPR